MGEAWLLPSPAVPLPVLRPCRRVPTSSLRATCFSRVPSDTVRSIDTAKRATPESEHVLERSRASYAVSSCFVGCAAPPLRTDVPTNLVNKRSVPNPKALPSPFAPSLDGLSTPLPHPTLPHHPPPPPPHYILPKDTAVARRALPQWPTLLFRPSSLHAPSMPDRGGPHRNADAWFVCATEHGPCTGVASGSLARRGVGLSRPP